MTGIHFGEIRCLRQEVSRGQKGLGPNEILQEFAKFSCTQTANRASSALMGREGNWITLFLSSTHPYMAFLLFQLPKQPSGMRI